MMRSHLYDELFDFMLAYVPPRVSNVGQLDTDNGERKESRKAHNELQGFQSMG